jgi:hypothetical protein
VPSDGGLELQRTGFSSAEAGQRSEFSVTPRDEYGNRRCQTIYDLSDVLSARAVPLTMLTVYESSAKATKH